MPETRRYEEATKWIHSGAAEELINRSGQARLIRLIVGTSAAGTCTIYNSATASGDVVAVINTSAVGSYEYGFILPIGLTLDKTGTADIVLIYE